MPNTHPYTEAYCLTCGSPSGECTGFKVPRLPVKVHVEFDNSNRAWVYAGPRPMFEFHAARDHDVAFVAMLIAPHEVQVHWPVHNGQMGKLRADEFLVWLDAARRRGGGITNDQRPEEGSCSTP